MSGRLDLSPATWTAEESLAGVQAGLDRCLALCRDEATLRLRASGVSAWSVRDHVEHLLLGTRGVSGWMFGAARGTGPRTRFPRGFAIALLDEGRIPRGRGPAPDGTLPTGIDAKRLREELAQTRAQVDELEPLLPRLAASPDTLPHHVLGHFGATEWLRFLDLHHRHHDAIIADILAAAT